MKISHIFLYFFGGGDVYKDMFRELGQLPVQEKY